MIVIIERVITAFYLAVSTAIVVVAFRSNFLTMAKNEFVMRRLTTMFCIAYAVALTLVFTRVFKGSNIIVYGLLLSFAPFIWFLLRMYEKGHYQWSLKLLILALVLTSLGLVVQYHVGKTSGGILAKVFLMEKIPVAVNQLIFSAISLVAVSSLLLSGMLKKAIDWAEKRTNYVFWGFISLALLLLPLLFGARIGGTASWVISGSIQTSEFVLKICFATFIAKFLSERPMLMLRAYPPREIIKIVLAMAVFTFIFFVFPLVFLQRELGTTLLLAITLVIMTTFASRRISFFFIGIGLIALSIAIATCLSDHVAERIIGGWLEWREYAFKPYHEGGRYWTGWQAFLARAAYKGSSLWGVGLASGYPRVIPQVSTDMISAAIVQQTGVISLGLILFIYILFLTPILDNKIKPDFRGTLLVGIIVVLVTQAFYNLSAAMYIVPISGVPLVFLSNGGTSILSNFLLIGIMMSLIETNKSSGDSCESN